MDGKQHLQIGELAGSSGMKTLADAIPAAGKKNPKKPRKSGGDEKDKDGKDKAPQPSTQCVMPYKDFSSWC